MNKKARKSIFAAPIAALAIAACTAHAAVLTDNFTTQFDYSGGAVQGIWNGSYNMPALAGGIVGASPSFADNGLLVIDYDANLGWEGGRSTAPFLYVDVPADQNFIAEVTIASQTSGNWSAAGLLARAKQGTPPGSAADNADEHFVTMYSFRTNAANPNAGNTLFKRIEAGVQVQDNSIPILAVGDEPLPIRLRLERNGSTFSGSVSVDNGATWQVQSSGAASLTSPLITGAPLEVGIAFSSFDPALLGVAKFDDFRLETRPIPEPATAVLAAIGLASVAVSRKRRS
jgi:hypothetical protein